MTTTPKAGDPVEVVPAVIAGNISAQAASTPTQVRRPWRSTARTVFQALIGLTALAPLVAAAVEEATGYDLEGVPFIVVALAASAAVTRVMAVPGVEAWLRRFLPFLAAAPAPTDPVTDRGDRGEVSWFGVVVIALLVLIVLILAGVIRIG